MEFGQDASQVAFFCPSLKLTLIRAGTFLCRTLLQWGLHHQVCGGPEDPSHTTLRSFQRESTDACGACIYSGLSLLMHWNWERKVSYLTGEGKHRLSLGYINSTTSAWE